MSGGYFQRCRRREPLEPLERLPQLSASVFGARRCFRLFHINPEEVVPTCFERRRKLGAS